MCSNKEYEMNFLQILVRARLLYWKEILAVNSCLFGQSKFLYFPEKEIVSAYFSITLHIGIGENLTEMLHRTTSVHSKFMSTVWFQPLPTRGIVFFLPHPHVTWCVLAPTHMWNCVSSSHPHVDLCVFQPVLPYGFVIRVKSYVVIKHSPSCRFPPTIYLWKHPTSDTKSHLTPLSAGSAQLQIHSAIHS